MSTGPLSPDSGFGALARAATRGFQAASGPAEPGAAMSPPVQDLARMFQGKPSEMTLQGDQHAGNARSAGKSSRA